MTVNGTKTRYALRQDNAALRRALPLPGSAEAMRDLPSFTTAADGRVTWTSAGFQALEHHHPQLSERLNAALLAFRGGAAGALSAPMTAQLELDHGRIFQIAFERWGDGGQGVLVDITDQARHAAELEVKLAEAQAEVSETRHAMATLAHELRTPLSAVLGFSELLSLDPRLEAQAGILGNLTAAARHLIEVSEDLLSLATLEASLYAPQQERIDLADLIEETIGLLQPIADAAEIAVSTDYSPALPDVSGDRMKLRRVLINLMGNACKYTNAGGEIRITAGVGPEGATVTIADTGIGIDAALLPRIGQPFVHGSDGVNGQSGTGLGLALSKAIAEAHGGQLRIDSCPGEGTVVTLVLPRSRLCPPKQPCPGGL